MINRLISIIGDYTIPETIPEDFIVYFEFLKMTLAYSISLIMFIILIKGFIYLFSIPFKFLK